MKIKLDFWSSFIIVVIFLSISFLFGGKCSNEKLIINEQPKEVKGLQFLEIGNYIIIQTDSLRLYQNIYNKYKTQYNKVYASLDGVNFLDISNQYYLEPAPLNYTSYFIKDFEIAIKYEYCSVFYSLK